MSYQCSTCQAPYEISDREKVFYNDIRVNAPKDCPDCRMRNRCVHRNEMSLYRRGCDLCGKKIVAMYPESAPFPVYCSDCFFGDQWNPFAFGAPYDPSRSFFDQYAELLNRVPHLGIINKQCHNSEYCNYAYANKNCYLTFGSHSEEDCQYEAYSTKNKSSLDFLWNYACELVYESTFCSNCYRSIYLRRCEDCDGCLFSRDLKGCNNCMFCANLHQKKYCIFNEELSKEEYFKRREEMKLHTYSGFVAAREAFFREMPRRFPVRAFHQTQCEDCEGSTMNNCRNLRETFFCSDCEDCMYGCQLDNCLNCTDVTYMGYDRSERCYQTIGCLGLFGCIGCNACWHGSTLGYCQFCFSCSECLGCVSLQQQNHCILNTQYSTEQHSDIIAQIVESMRNDGTWGSFFPKSLSPFAYNETIAMDWFPLEREQAIAAGYNWKKDDDRPDVSKIIPAEQLPESIKDIPDDILNWGITCSESGRPFKITKQELEFYRGMELPVPHLHPDIRHRNRIARRSKRKLWDDTCKKCGTKIKTTHDPEMKLTVYCEECYLGEVY